MPSVMKFELVPLAYKGTDRSHSVEYWLVGTDLDGEYISDWLLNPANTWLGNTPPLPLAYDGKPLAEYDFDEYKASTHYRITAKYETPSLGGGSGPGGPTPGEATFSFDFGTESVKVVKSLGTISKYPSSMTLPAATPVTWIAANGGTPIDHHGALGVNKDGIPEGIEKATGISKLVVDYTLPNTYVNANYLGTLSILVATVNSSTLTVPSVPVLTFQPGTMLFDGAQIKTQVDSTVNTTIQFSWSFRPNRTFSLPNIKGLQSSSELLQPQSNRVYVGSEGTGVIVQDGWDYLWVQYTEEVKADNVAPSLRTVAAFVDRIYERANHNLVFTYNQSGPANNKFSTSFSDDFA